LYVEIAEIYASSHPCPTSTALLAAAFATMLVFEVSAVGFALYAAVAAIAAADVEASAATIPGRSAYTELITTVAPARSAAICVAQACWVSSAVNVVIGGYGDAIFKSSLGWVSEMAATKWLATAVENARRYLLSNLGAARAIGFQWSVCTLVKPLRIFEGAALSSTH
jgi:hypothetical protein